MYHLRRFTIIFSILLVLSFLTWLLPRVLSPTPSNREKQIAERRWIDTSPYWLDRQTCRWFSLCGLHHLRWDPPALPGERRPGGDEDDGELRLELRSEWRSEQGVSFGHSARWEHEGVGIVRRRAERSAVRNVTLKEIPSYVLKYAPIVHLSNRENFWPADMAEHVRHMTAMVNGQPVNWTDSLSLDNLHLLNAEPAEAFLSSKDDVELRPEWLHSHVGIPKPFDGDDDDDDPEPGSGRGPAHDGTTWWDVGEGRPLHRISNPKNFGPPTNEHHDLAQDLFRPRYPPVFRRSLETQTVLSSDQRPHQDGHHIQGHKPDVSGRSDAPIVLILVDKGYGVVDAFYFFFYSYNLGQTVMDTRYGNHVSDWEHCMIRFENGVPRGIFLSEHEGGLSLSFDAVTKRGGRPVLYSAVGSHAVYPKPGDHPYVLPFNMLRDQTDDGPIWDPAKNTYSFWYDPSVPDPADPRELPSSLTPTAENPDAPTSWFFFKGYWGDEVFPLADRRQWRLFGQLHYVTGPQGPRFKRLDRDKMCQSDVRCKILHAVRPGQTWYG